MVLTFCTGSILPIEPMYFDPASEFLDKIRLFLASLLCEGAKVGKSDRNVGYFLLPGEVAGQDHHHCVLPASDGHDPSSDALVRHSSHCSPLIGHLPHLIGRHHWTEGWRMTRKSPG